MTKFTLSLWAAVWPITWVLFVLTPAGIVVWPLLLVVPAALALALAVSASWVLLLMLVGTFRMLGVAAHDVSFAVGRSEPLLKVVHGGGAVGRATPPPAPARAKAPDPRWLKVGFRAGSTMRWQRHGFAPEAARAWSNAGFEPAAARAWRAAGFTAGRARAWRARGLDVPRVAEWTVGVYPLAVPGYAR